MIRYFIVPILLILSGVAFVNAQNAVGIGDVSFTPNYLLHIHSGSAGGVLLQATNSTTGTTTGDGFTINLNGSHVELNNVENADMRFFTNNTERIRVLSGGNVGIGNLAPAERLDVIGNVRFSGALMPGGSAGTTDQLLVSQGGSAAPVWVNKTAVVQIFSDLQGTLATAYTNNTITYSNTLIANSFTLSAPGYYEFVVWLGSPIATSAVGMNFRLQNITSTTTLDGPYYCQFPAPSLGDYGSATSVLLYYNKTTTTSETIQVQWAATSAGGTTGVQSLAGSRTSRIVVFRYPN